MIKNDLLIFFQYHIENGIDLTYIKNPNLFFEIFWKYTVFFEADSDPYLYENKYPRFSQEWQSLWITRKELCKSTKIKIKGDLTDLNGKKRKSWYILPLGYGVYPETADDIWVNMFNDCWITDHKLKSHRKAFEKVIKELRQTTVPWKTKRD